MGAGKRPRPPDPYRTAQAQQEFNRGSLRDAITANQIGQTTPWGSISYTGEVGGPDRMQHVTLNPQDQAVLDMQRSIRQGLLGAVLGGGGASGKQGMAQQPPPVPAGGMSAQPQGLSGGLALPMNQPMTPQSMNSAHRWRQPVGYRGM